MSVPFVCMHKHKWPRKVRNTKPVIVFTCSSNNNRVCLCERYTNRGRWAACVQCVQTV